MKDGITLPDHFPDLNEEDLRREKDLKVAANRRDAYSLVRDLQAKDNNQAIASRLDKSKESTGEDNPSFSK
jgi:hypothetical protein